MTWTGPEETAEADATGSGFADFGLPEPLLGVLAGNGIKDPFPIQAATIPDALAGRDVLGRAQTGSGKTLGFGLPLLARLSGTASRLPRGLILVPTRELALQVADAIAPLAKSVGLSVTLIAGGMPYGPQRRAFEQGVDVVVATPGRLIDLLDQAICDLSKIEITVLDEADHMADLGFLPAVTTLLDTVPAGGQRLLFSATLDSGINRLVRTYLSDPATHQVDSDRASVATMSHHVVHVQPKDKTVLTAELAARDGRTVIFVRTQRGADRIAGQLREAGVTAGALHGGLTQGARTRILAAFKEGRIPALVATDVAARGIHVDDVGLVLQVDPPNGPKEYLHRAGRTARAGGSGAVVTLALPHQRRELDRLTRQAGVKATPVIGESGDPALVDATGARTPTGEPISDADYQRLISPPKPPRGAGRTGQRPFRGRQGSGGRKGFGDRRGSGDRRRPRRDDSAALR
ncbi:DEAD/DEAH box helicase [Microlunatus parietis]|uniref:Superfamily II DNA/RNA helicase n=1 Tax=Microlunatus parietis TaxID=682979 RepID=A0A7Y9I6A6_9ACTN|nr:DEAD/DEAH box helicase [Microlunatus parietis]NYE71030.1 superfamily II DNA/RNA helicase [Microlunatus parietis]